MTFDTKYRTQYGQYDHQKTQNLLMLGSQFAQLSKLKKSGFSNSISAGLLTAAFGVFLWAILANIVNFPTNFVTIGIALWLAEAVKRASLSSHKKFCFVGAVISMLVCFVGSPIVAYVSSTVETQQAGPFVQFVQNYWNSYQYLDYFYFAVAIYVGFKYSRYKKKNEDSYTAYIYPPVK